MIFHLLKFNKILVYKIWIKIKVFIITSKFNLNMFLIINIILTSNNNINNNCKITTIILIIISTKIYKFSNINNSNNNFYNKIRNNWVNKTSNNFNTFKMLRILSLEMNLLKNIGKKMIWALEILEFLIINIILNQILIFLCLESVFLFLG